MPMPLTPELEAARREIEGHAREFGLDFYDTIFEILDYEEMNQAAAYGGFPTHYPHWRYGMEFERLSKSYTYGLHRIYEMVLNNDPCYAYLLECNELTDQKLVMAHVYAHCDFFKHNAWFSATSRKMLDEMANHSARVRRYIDAHSHDQVESFLDTCLSLENLIDYHAPYIRRREPRELSRGDSRGPLPEPARLKSKGYMDEFVNPEEFLASQRAHLEADRTRARRLPESPEKDVLLFLVEHAPLEDWERDILGIVREEAYYFAPQAMTRIMNEGWASFWHSRIMTTRALKDGEVIDYADHHSGTVATHPGRINPYKLGLELFRDIEDRWNRGRFGKEYDECDELAAKRVWDLKTGLGLAKISEVRRVHNDISFIDAFLTQEFCEQHKLFTYAYDRKTRAHVIADRNWRTVKQQLLFQLTNLGDPFIYVADANFGNKGELYLFHRHEGIDLDLPQARDTLAAVQRIWKRPVSLETRVDGRRKLLAFDGQEHTDKGLTGEPGYVM